jgi:hypothetical protein
VVLNQVPIAHGIATTGKVVQLKLAFGRQYLTLMIRAAYPEMSIPGQ